MKLEHLIQGYKHNGIEAELERKIEADKSGVIKFYDGITAAFFEEEDIVKSIQVFANPITPKEKTISNQVNHSANWAKVIAFTIDLLSSITVLERNMLMKSLGILNGTFKQGKQIKHLDRMYKIEIVQGLILFTMSEVEDE